MVKMPIQYAFMIKLIFVSVVLIDHVPNVLVLIIRWIVVKDVYPMDGVSKGSHHRRHLTLSVSVHAVIMVVYANLARNYSVLPLILCLLKIQLNFNSFILLWLFVFY